MPDYEGNLEAYLRDLEARLHRLEGANGGLEQSISPESVANPLDLSDQVDETFKQLWSEKLSQSLAAADTLYAPYGDQHLAHAEVQDRVVVYFRRLLLKAAPHLPELPEARYAVIVQSIYRVLRIVRETPTDDCVEEFYAVALRPVRRLHLGALTEEVCAGLIDFYRGQWHPYLLKSQLYVIETALAKTVAALPPDEMEPFWANLLSPNPITRNAMLLGLRQLSAAHGVTHLLHGLEELTDHTTRSAIVDHLEKIAEPAALPTLIRLHRETASNDWTLSRQIGRAIRVIERQNRGQDERVLLRPTTTPIREDRSLLRPMTASNPTDPADLLRPTGDPSLPASPQNQADP
jgi:hypothetical protein